ncbi:hypothetical protein [Xanthomonas fragariae]|uniref:hypothetical protein n=1 Tax=Xanthomonas fragariae TaxID=48664 RepID=UPI000D556DA3|nr:hypothetical protein [Xanthomonas fragariae]MEA5251014.1 hypothetical protein [Xanthomonas fragariae]
MLKVAILSCALAVGLSATVANAGQAGQAKVDQAAAVKAPWALNEVHAAYNPAKKYTIVDVNDKFLIKSTPDAGGGKVNIAFLDGARAKLGTCATAPKLKPGEARTTWLQLSYSKPDADGKRQFIVRRTLDFNGHDQEYRFTAGNGTLATLEPGVRVGLDRGVLVYEQATGPIGMSGDTKGVRVTYRLNGKFNDIASTVEMDDNRWTVATSQANEASAPIYTVNTTAVAAYVPGTNSLPHDRAVVANPTRGNGIGPAADGYMLKVSGAHTFKQVENLQVHSVVTQSLCLALPCSFDFQCNGTSTSCSCHDLSTGPQLGTCLI